MEERSYFEPLPVQRIPPDYVPGDLPLPEPAAPVQQVEPQRVTPEGRCAEDAETRVRLTGRLAYVPKVHEFPKGGIRVTFSLAEHFEDGSTIYHNVYSTKRFAERIRDRDLQ